MGDFCVLFGKDPAYTQTLLVLADAGDLILWDSRTVHGGQVGTGRPETNEPQLARLTQTVCMIPRKWADADTLEWRRKAFEQGLGTTHWPNEPKATCYPGKSYRPITLSAEQAALL
jgi:hypothetical protein